ncbi:class I SAM-dependent methyltransferase [Polyangium sorediatum]|uniref:S-adenosyl-L-methionine-dependent methyltransferase n=1 Tax=Polyangium sorediatum TaxID=889274 RepID=A0ABT6NR23_9BACT|nr:SAM-dependent methyltransferase [Polyangium sorediatum]MDI1430763.1 SAM-dependent methyltransferase [Polyangium sorediatum]
MPCHSEAMQQPSRTARMVAALRARATERETPLCDDPFARALAGPRGFEDAARYEQGYPHIELFVALRTALFDQETRRWLARGCTQVVLLGAGLDTRAARLGQKGVRFFEVDHPTTQADKLARLSALPGYPFENATYVPCDFAVNDFVERLDSSGFLAEQPALLIWEGVTYYLEEPAVRATLRRIAEKLHPNSVILFDHVGKRMGQGNVRDASAIAARDNVAEMGEPVVFGVDHVLPMLYEEGFRRARCASFDEIALNLTGTYDRARTFRFQHAVVASVAEDVGA